MSRHRRLDALVHNTGTMQAQRLVTVDGFETTFAVNLLGPFYLTHLLLEPLRAAEGARVVNVSTKILPSERLDFDDLFLAKRYSMVRAYATSKLAGLYFTYEANRRFAGAQIYVNAAHPGLVATKMMRQMRRTGPRFWRAMAAFMGVVAPPAAQACRDRRLPGLCP